jgi:LmbE family N-acetylglucosaminyl deacetylase
LEYDTLIISPHLDDAFYSLGGYLLKSRPAKRKIIDIFTTSGFAPRFKRYGLDINQTSLVRRWEELKNASIVDAIVEFLNFLDAPLRGYASPFDPPKWKEEAEMIETIKSRLCQIIEGAKIIFFPLGIGKHVDHVILFRLGLEFLLESHSNIRFYEDLPYAAGFQRWFRLDANIGRARLESKLVSIDPIGKLKLCFTYKSQCSPNVPLKIMMYSKMMRPLGGFYERVWSITDLRTARKLTEVI